MTIINKDNTCCSHATKINVTLKIILNLVPVKLGLFLNMYSLEYYILTVLLVPDKISCI